MNQFTIHYLRKGSNKLKTEEKIVESFKDKSFEEIKNEMKTIVKYVKLIGDNSLVINDTINYYVISARKLTEEEKEKFNKNRLPYTTLKY